MQIADMEILNFVVILRLDIANLVRVVTVLKMQIARKEIVVAMVNVQLTKKITHIKGKAISLNMSAFHVIQSVVVLVHVVLHQECRGPCVCIQIRIHAPMVGVHS
jgi:hypothetical protein